MTVFGKSASEYVRFVRLGLLALVAVGVVRFVVGISGFAYERATHLTSITIVVFVLALIYGQRAAAVRFGGYRHLIPIALLLGTTMYGFIIVAILVEGLGGIHGFFHSPGSGFAPESVGLSEHVLGQLSVMPTMTASILGVLALGYAISRHLFYLRYAILLLVAMAVFRFLAGLIGVPAGPGKWATSLVILSVGLAIYYGYGAPSSGLHRYRDAVVIGIVLAVLAFHLAVYGFVVSRALAVSTYYDAGSSASLPMHIEHQLRGAPWLLLYLVGGALIGFAVSRRRAG
jgi:hypothetical protein